MRRHALLPALGCVALVLFLLADPGAVGAVRPDYPVTAQSLKKLCRLHPSTEVVAGLLKDEDRFWMPVLDQIRAGRAEWLENAVCLWSGAVMSRSAAVPRALEQALAEALARNPAPVLSLERRGVSLAGVCSLPFLTPDREQLERHVHRTRESLARVRAPALEMERTLCALRLESAWERLGAVPFPATGETFRVDERSPDLPGALARDGAGNGEPIVADPSAGPGSGDPAMAGPDVAPDPGVDSAPGSSHPHEPEGPGLLSPEAAGVSEGAELPVSGTPDGGAVDALATPGDPSAVGGRPGRGSAPAGLDGSAAAGAGNGDSPTESEPDAGAGRPTVSRDGGLSGDLPAVPRLESPAGRRDPGDGQGLELEQEGQRIPRDAVPDAGVSPAASGSPGLSGEGARAVLPGSSFP